MVRSHADLDVAGRRALLEEQLAQAHVGVAAAGPDGVFGMIPSSWPIEGALRLRGRWLLDFLDAPSQECIVRAWRALPRDKVFSTHVGLRGGQVATAWLIDLMDCDGAVAALLVTERDLAAQLPDGQSHVPPPQVAVVRRNAFGEVIAFDDRAPALLGWSQHALNDRNSLGLHRDDHDIARANWGNLLADPDGIYRFRARLRRQDGTFRWFDITERTGVDDAGDRYVEDELVDVDSEVAALQAVHDREAKLHQLMEAVPVGIGHLNGDGGVAYANDMIRQMLSADPADDITLLSALEPDDRGRVHAAVAAIMRDGQAQQLVISSQHGGDARTFSLVLRPLDPQDVSIGVIACASDITDSRRLREALERRVNVDHLTEVATRSRILTTLADHLGDDARGVLGVLFVDLDGFKAVNDRLGHATGDQILRTVAQRINGALRAGDTVGRLGGDEFLVVCPRLGNPVEIQRIADRVTAALAEPMQVGSQVIALSASIGIAHIDSGPEDADEIVARADAQMYRAKALGGGRALAAP